MRTGWIGAIGAAAMLAACSSSGSSSVAASPVAATNVAALTAAGFVEQAASAALFAIEAARLAEVRSSDADVRRIARMQREAGEAIGSQLSYAGPRVNAVPRNTLVPAHEALLARLRAAPDFDDAYLEQQKDFVTSMRAFHRDYAVRGGSATLRPVADYGAEKLDEQLQAIERAD
ncbi:DUF4142 domain-containing protein [Sphingomicrobium sp. XHP0239]|uniref:DUF4142 domain-containing protein n=1 Tax=Sphingomicrobium maritimum TaxID=3133972 RepID=UPI0031CCBD0C